MSNSVKPEKIISAMASVIASITNMRLYPPSSAIITNAIDKAYNSIRSALIQDPTLLIAESENNILISGQALSYKYQQLPQISTLRDIMASLRIKSIIIKREMLKSEFKTFISIMSMSPDDVELEGGIQKITSNASLDNISLTPKIYVAVDQEDGILNSLDQADIDMIRAALGERNITDNEYMRIGEKANDPRWVSDLFESGLNQLNNSGASYTEEIYHKSIGNMLEAFETSTPLENRKPLSVGIANSLFDADSELFSVLMANNYDSGLTDGIIKALSDDQYVEFVSKVHCIREYGEYADKKINADEKERFNSVFRTLTKNKRTSVLGEEIKKRITQEKKKNRRDKAYLTSSLEKIKSGEQEPLLDEKLMAKIPAIVSRLFADDQEPEARVIVNRLSAGLVGESKDIRISVSDALLKIGEKFTGEDGRNEMTRLAQNLNLWIKTETEITPSYEPVCNLLQNHSRYLYKKNLYADGNQILETFSFIYYDRVPKIDAIKAIAGKVIRNIATEEIFDRVLHEFNTNNNNEGKNAYYTLIRLGTISLESLLDLLRSSSDMAHRVRIMNAIAEIGKISLPVIVERIQQSRSWFYVRNLLKLLTQMGGVENLDVLKQLLTSENTNISNAALHCAFEIGGEERLKFFTRALAIERDKQRAAAVDLLGKLGSEEVVYPLTELLKGEATGSAEDKNALDIAICVALGKIGSKKAVPALKTIVKHKGVLGIGAYSPEVRAAAAKAIELLNQKPQEKIAIPGEDGTDTALQNRISSLMGSDPAKIEALVKEYIRQNNISEAVKVLYQLIVKLAREKNFVKAEEMRNWLFDVDPMALSEIVRSGDVIESEKSSVVANEYIDIWSGLYESLTEEEANALFYSVVNAEYDLNETIIQQGYPNSRLYFVNRGQLKIVYGQNDNEFFLKMLGAGDIAGSETFFPITVSTISLITLSKVKLGYIERDELKNIERRFPLLEKKLLEYCSVGASVDTLINKKGIERRQQERVDVKGKTIVQLLEESNKPLGKPFKGDMIDVSLGGLAFRIKTKKRDTARLLLGRKLKVIAGIVTVDTPIEVSRTGVIIGAKEKKKGLFSIHLKFDSFIAEDKIEKIRSTAIPE